MTATAVHHLDVPGARLHYETRGSGPVLLMICGGHTDAGIFAAVAGLLAERHTVVTYDPRGNSRSTLDGPPTDQRIEVHADDARRLVEAVGEGPVSVFGSSSGAIVALDLVARHPDRVRTAVVHEPPAVTLLPDAERHRAFFAGVYDTYRRDGTEAALRMFAAGVGLEEGGGPPAPGDAAPPATPPEMLEMVRRMTGNLDFFLAHEVRSFTDHVPDVPALARAGTRIVLAGGEESRAHLPYLPNTVLAERLGLTIVDFPGDHTGYVSRPEPFAALLDKILAG
ncbi:MAG: alpha/beta fold hydrolase [Actinocatenispora sp.]